LSGSLTKPEVHFSQGGKKKGKKKGGTLPLVVLLHNAVVNRTLRQRRRAKRLIFFDAGEKKRRRGPLGAKIEPSPALWFGISQVLWHLLGCYKKGRREKKGRGGENAAETENALCAL